MARAASCGSRYALSFTSGSLLMHEALVAASVHLHERSWEGVRRRLEAENLLQARTVATGQRLAREITQRLATLDDAELVLLVDSTASERGYILWAAACRRYRLIGEFAEEVLRERFLLLNPTLGHDEFDSFLRGKAIWHEEVAELKDSTLRKLRSNLFRMLTEAGLLSDAGEILPAVLSARLTATLHFRKPSDIRFFPTAGGWQ